MSGKRVVVGCQAGRLLGRGMAAEAAGYDVVGLFMKNWEDDDDDEYCSTQDLIDAAAARTSSASSSRRSTLREYKDRVFAEFLREYSQDVHRIRVLCNAEIKFKASSITRSSSVPSTLRLGITRGPGARRQFELLRGVDPGKDQSYFLHRLNQAQWLVRSSSGRPAQAAGPRDRARHRLPNAASATRPASASWRAPVPRVPEPLSADAAGPSATRVDAWSASTWDWPFTRGSAQGHRMRPAR